MKRIIYILILISGFWSCNNQTEKTAVKNPVDTLQTFSAGKKQSNIYISDKSQYDQTFIDGLINYTESIKLIDNFIITGIDTAYFPDDLPLNKMIVFKGAKENNRFELSVTRINETTLTYNLRLSDKKNRTLNSKTGKAILGSMFFLASEVDEDDLTGTAYGSSEYWEKANACWFSIRIGIGKDDNGKQRAMVTYGCEDKNKQNLNLDKCPTLRTG